MIKGELSSYFDFVIQDISELSETQIEKISFYNCADIISRVSDWDKSILISPLEHIQPKSHGILEDSQAVLNFGFKWYSIPPLPWAEKDSLSLKVFITVKDLVVFINPPRYKEYNSGVYSNVDCIPSFILNSWFYRAGTWGIYTPPGASSESRQLLNHPHSFWPSIENILFTFDKDWRRKGLMSKVMNSIPDVYVTHVNEYDGSENEWCALRCLLDTREYGNDKPVGYQLFVNDSHLDEVVYLIKDGDVASIKVMDPVGLVELIDQYSSAVLKGEVNRLNFLDYCK